MIIVLLFLPFFRLNQRSYYRQCINCVCLHESIVFIYLYIYLLDLRMHHHRGWFILVVERAHRHFVVANKTSAYHDVCASFQFQNQTVLSWRKITGIFGIYLDCLSLRATITRNKYPNLENYDVSSGLDGEKRNSVKKCTNVWILMRHCYSNECYSNCKLLCKLNVLLLRLCHWNFLQEP